MKIISTIIICLGTVLAFNAQANDTSTKLIEAQLTVEGMKMGMKSGVSKSCFDSGEPLDTCFSEMDRIDQIDLQGLLSKVYSEVYTEDQMLQLYSFYATETGRKYSKGLLYILALQLDYPAPYQMPSFTEAEESSILNFQASDISQMEKALQPKIQESLSKYLGLVLKSSREGYPTTAEATNP